MKRIITDKPILVSACLLGVQCRYNGTGALEEEIARLKEKYVLIPICPEILGGLPTPRIPCERLGNLVRNRNGEDMSDAFHKGALETLQLAKFYGCTHAILKERSPSCGHGMIYDGSFSGTLTPGDGITTQLLKEHGITVLGESQINKYFQNIL